METQIERKKFKHTAQVRAFMAKQQRDYRSRQKQKAEGATDCSPDSNSPSRSDPCRRESC